MASLRKIFERSATMKQIEMKIYLTDADERLIQRKMRELSETRGHKYSEQDVLKLAFFRGLIEWEEKGEQA